MIVVNVAKPTCHRSNEDLAVSLAQTRPSSSDSDVVPTDARIQRVPWPIVPLERCLRWAFAQLLTGDAFPVGKSRSWDILLQPCDGGLDAFVRSRGGLELVGTLAPGDTQATTLKATLRQRSGTGHQVVLRLSPDQVLQRPIEVPMAAEDVLAQVLTHQMERWTPWPATQSLMGYKILARDTEAGVIRAQVVFTSKVLVEQTRARLQALGLAPPPMTTST